MIPQHCLQLQRTLPCNEPAERRGRSVIPRGAYVYSEPPDIFTARGGMIMILGIKLAVTGFISLTGCMLTTNCQHAAKQMKKSAAK